MHIRIQNITNFLHVLGGAIIVTAPHNKTKIEGDKAEFLCEAKGMPSNITITWYRGNDRIDEIEVLESRRKIRTDGTLEIHPLTSDDSGKYRCEVTNGIGGIQLATAYLNVECKPN